VSRERVPLAVVHVTAERFRQGCRGQLADPIQLTERFDAALARHASGWQKPSADEAFVRGQPWGRGRSPMDWANGLREDVTRELHLDCSVGIAATRVAARICSRMARPRGILLCRDGHESALIGGLPLEALDELRPAQLTRLRSEGIRTFCQLAALGSTEARALLGSEGNRLLSLVRGVEGVSDETIESRLSMAASLLARRLSRRLSRRGRYARGLELQIIYADGVTSERYILLARATSARDEILQAALRLVEMHPRRQEPVSDVVLTATGLVGLQGRLDLPDEPFAFPLFGHESPREVRVRLGAASREDAAASSMASIG
jgi:DNA polymerase-4